MQRPRDIKNVRFLFPVAMSSTKTKYQWSTVAPGCVSQEFETIFLYSSKQWQSDSGYHNRFQKLNHRIKDIEAKTKADRDASQDELSSKDPDTTAFTRHQLKWFQQKYDVYFSNQLSNIRFTKYRQTAKARSRLAAELCPTGSTYTVFIGDALIAPNNPIKK